MAGKLTQVVDITYKSATVTMLSAMKEWNDANPTSQKPQKWQRELFEGNNNWIRDSWKQEQIDDYLRQNMAYSKTYFKYAGMMELVDIQD